MFSEQSKVKRFSFEMHSRAGDTSTHARHFRLRCFFLASILAKAERAGEGRGVVKAQIIINISPFLGLFLLLHLFTMQTMEEKYVLRN